MEFKKHGPVLTAEIKDNFGVIFNCGAAEYKDKIYLLPRVIEKGYKKRKKGGYDKYISKVYLAESDDGKNFKISKNPFLSPGENYDKYGCEDPRVTKLKDRFFITYTALSRPAYSGKGKRIGLASTKDFSEIKKHGIMGPNIEDKNTVIFPETIKRKVVVLHRAEPEIQIIFFDSIEDLIANKTAGFWESYLENIEDHLFLKREYKWETAKIGAGPPPIKTEKGWLLIYHGVDSEEVYRAGVVLLDLKDPQKIIARSPTPILEPSEDYEKEGHVPFVVFPTGAVIKGGDLFLYYGAADEKCCLATCNLEKLIDFLLKKRNK